jgi:hypothetical protein
MANPFSPADDAGVSNHVMKMNAATEGVRENRCRILAEVLNDI